MLKFHGVTQGIYPAVRRVPLIGPLLVTLNGLSSGCFLALQVANNVSSEENVLSRLEKGGGGEMQCQK